MCTCEIRIFNKLEVLLIFVWELLEYRTLHVYEIFIDHKKTDLCEAVSEFQTRTPKIGCVLEENAIMAYENNPTLQKICSLGYDFEWFESFPRYEMRLLLVVFFDSSAALQQGCLHCKCICYFFQL